MENTLGRRPFLAGVFSLVSSCAVRSQAQAIGGVSADGLPYIGPGSAWNGTAASGYAGAVPAAETRVTASPAVQFWTPSKLRFASDLVIGVDADALGGIAHVEFYVEGATQKVGLSLYEDKDVNGLPRRREGYWLRLNPKAFTGRNAKGTVHVYARATAKDGTMQTRLMGPLILYPRDAESDFVKTIAPSGADFSSLRAALGAAQAAGAEAPMLTITQSGDYEVEDGTWPRYVNGKGFCVVQAAPGVTATLKRSAMPTTIAGFPWDIRYDGVEFRGKGIILDKRNFTTIGTANNPAGGRINGAKVTNSIGTRDTLYWFKGVPPVGLFVTPSYLEDSTFEYVPGAGSFQVMVANCNFRGILGDVFTGTHFVVGTYHDSMDQGFYRTSIDSLSVAYTGSGVATIEKSAFDGGGASHGSNGNNTQKIFLRVSDVTVASIALGSMPTDANYNVSDVVNAINNVPGWSATLLDDSRHASHLLGKGFGNTNGFDRTVVNATPKTLITLVDIHADWWQAYTGGPIRSNAILRNNVQLGMMPEQGNEMFLLDAHLQDIIIAGNAFGGNGAWNCGNGNNSHVYMYNCDAPLSAFTTPNGTCDKYCRYENLVVGLAFINAANNSNQIWPAYPAFVNCYFWPHVHGVPNSPNNKGNIVGKQGQTLFVSPTTGDFRPAGLLLSNLRDTSAILVRDGRLNPRQPMDAIGAWGIGGQAPKYPF